MGYDEVVTLLGDFGRYQKRIYFLLCLPVIICAFHKLGIVFLIAEPNYRCKLPGETSNASYQLNETVLQSNYPWDNVNNKYSSCEIQTGGDIEKCDLFIFDNTVYGYTAVIEWNLTCNNAYLIANGNAIFMAGVMFGSILFGELSDRYGRKLIFFISLVIQVFFGVIASLAPEFWTFTISRFIVGASTSGVFLVSYVIALEMVGPMKRLIAGTVCQMFFSLGYMLTAAMAIYINDWRKLQLAFSLPGIIFLCYWWFIPESARWLISKNRLPEAKALIHRAAKENKIELTDDALDVLLPENAKSKTEKTATILDVFRYPNIRKRSLIIFFDWFANNITYYGLSWSTNNLGGNPYLNFVLSGAVEIPAYCFLIATLNRWGRKRVMCGCMITSGIALLLTTVIPVTHQWLVVTLAMIGKLAITASYGAIYIFSTEQFPTVIRNAGLGASSTCARVGSVIAPFINITNKIWPPLPLVIFGTLSFIGGISSLTLPETLNKKLPETIEEGEEFGKKKKLIIDPQTIEKPKGDLLLKANSVTSGTTENNFEEV